MDNTPWSEETINRLNEFQKKGTFHPYTCPGDYKVCVNHRELIATRDGWICKCGKYTQKWANI